MMYLRKKDSDYRSYWVVGSLEVTDFIINNTFWVGAYPGMSDEMIDYMVNTIIDAVNI